MSKQSVEAANRMRGALEYLADYEKDPPEMLKDGWAYDRLLRYVHEVAQVGLGLIETTEDAK